MANIQISNLSFTYPGALQPVFSHVNLNISSGWRLGLIGRNGRGKTTFLNLLLGKLKPEGEIISPETFEYFPIDVQNPNESALRVAKQTIAPFEEWEQKMESLAQMATPLAMGEYGDIQNLYMQAGGYTIEEEIAAETGKLGIVPEVLQRPFASLSGGERVKLLLAALFLKRHSFLLIDEPTDHLDAAGRKIVADWLAGKSGFIVVSHDRAFLDTAIDHVLSINRADIELQQGNYSSWKHNRMLRDNFELAENKKLEASISRLEEAAKRTEKWSDRIEKSKKNNGLASYNKGPASADKGYIGHQAARMMQRSKAIEQRRGREMEEKRSLLKNIEEAEALKLKTLPAAKSRLLTASEITLRFGNRTLFEDLSFSIDSGQRIAVTGANGSGKSSLLKLVEGQLAPTCGSTQVLSGLIISTMPQETDFLKGPLRGFAQIRGVDESLFLALLRKLDFTREAFGQNMETYSAGQKKKVCLAASLATPAHLFVWDEPLNYIDVLSREQIEAAILQSGPTLLFVEHDAQFVQNVATDLIAL